MATPPPARRATRSPADPSTRPRLAYLVSHPIQYQVPLFRRLARSERISFVALFGCDFGARPSFDPQFGRVVDFGVDLLSGYEHRWVPELARRPHVDAFFGLATASPRRLLKDAGASALVVHGWRTALMWQGAVAARTLGVPYFMRAETPLLRAELSRSRSAKRVARDLAVGTLVRGAARLLTLGSANERFYLALGCDPGRLRRVPYFVDDAAVARAAAEGRARRAELRASLGVPADACVVACVGKLMRRKRQLDLVRAIAGLDASVHLVLVGSGELEETIRSEAAAAGVAARVHLAGFRGAEETWRLLGASDVFALVAADEPWGLVINEAVAAGLPIVASDECGAAHDLVERGVTGTVVRTGDVEAVASALAEWTGRVRRGDTGDAARRRELAERCSLEQAALRLEDVALEVTASTIHAERTSP